MATNARHKFHKRGDPQKVAALVQAAKDGDLAARDKLMDQFSPLVSSLIEVCLTSAYNRNPRSQVVRFLSMYTGRGKPLDNVAHMLRQQLASYSKKELWHIGELASLLAIERTKKNYSSTITLCFKELIDDLISDGISGHMDETVLSAKVAAQTEDDLIFDMWRQSLTVEEQDIVESILVGDKVQPEEISDELRAKLADYLGITLVIEEVELEITFDPVS